MSTLPKLYRSTANPDPRVNKLYLVCSKTYKLVKHQTDARRWSARAQAHKDVKDVESVVCDVVCEESPLHGTPEPFIDNIQQMGNCLRALAAREMGLNAAVP